jgi:hypothetical protein
VISFYHGRLQIDRRSLCENWRAIVRMPRSDQIEIDLGTPDMREAHLRAQYHYLALRMKQPIEEVKEIYRKKAACWSCGQWLPLAGECSFGFPEARQTGGRFAARCDLYDDGTGSDRTAGEGRGAMD